MPPSPTSGNVSFHLSYKEEAPEPLLLLDPPLGGVGGPPAEGPAAEHRLKNQRTST